MIVNRSIGKVLVALFGVLAMTTTGCGASDTNNVEVFSWWATGTEKAGLDALVQVFAQQHPDLNFINGSVAGGAGGNAKKVLGSRMVGGDPPDTFQAHAGKELAGYIKAGQLQDIKDLYDENGWGTAFPPKLLELLTQDGKIYSVPSNVHRANVLWANSDVLRKAGIDPNVPPADLDAWFVDLGKAAAAGVVPLAIGKDWTQVHLFEIVLLSRLGPDRYRGLFDGTGDWGTPEVGNALDAYARLLSYTNADRQVLDWSDATQEVIDGNAAYNVMGDWAEPALAGQKKSLGIDYTAHPAPGTTGVFDFLADSFTLPVGAQHEAGARAWLATVASADGQKAFNLAKGSIPARIDANPADYPPYQRSAIASYATDTIVPSLTHGAATSVAWLTDITSAISRFGVNGDLDALKADLVTAAAKNKR